MKAHYDAIAAQLMADVADVCNINVADIQVGMRSTAHPRYPNATIWLMPLDRSRSGARSIEQTWTFGIAVELPKSMAKEEAAEALKVQYADLLTQRLAPFDEDAVPAGTPARYAGVANRRSVEHFDPLHDLDSQGAWTFMIQFSCEADVFQ